MKSSPSTFFNVPILFLVFNRLDTTIKVFESIRNAKPRKLYIAADGARESVVNESSAVSSVRAFVIDNIDWECEVFTLFRRDNLGCKKAVIGAIDWFFDHEEMGVILEDDCLPNQSFFGYCENLLNRYKDTSEIFLISGYGDQELSGYFDSDYSFTKYPMIWGWATWKRVWDKYDSSIHDWKKDKESILNNISSRKETRRYWEDVLQSAYDEKIDTWDYQLAYLLFSSHGKCILPRENLVSNIGFGINATHTKDVSSNLANRASYNIGTRLQHPCEIIINDEIDNYLDKNLFCKKSFLIRVVDKAVRMLVNRKFL
jgi:hypothetical protein